MVEHCPNCGERAVVFVVANKWRCKKCGKYFDWTQIKGAKQKPAGGGAPPGGAPPP